MIACLSMPYFAAAIERRDRTMKIQGQPPTGKSDRPVPGLILGGQSWEPQPVYAFSWEAAKCGVQPGMSLRLAHVLTPQAEFMPANPDRYRHTYGEITEILADFTDRIESEELWSAVGLGPLAPTRAQYARSANGPLSLQGRAFARSLPAYYTLDLETLPVVDALSLSKEIGRSVRHHTYLPPALGLANDRFSAQIAAAVTKPNHIRSVTPEEKSDFLAKQTIHFLPLDREMARRLSLLGIRTLGQLTSLPIASLHSQLGLDRQNGREFTQMLRLIKGQIAPTSVTPYLDPHLPIHSLHANQQEQVVYYFDTPVDDLLILENVLARAAAELAGRLQKNKSEGRSVYLTIELDDEHSTPIITDQSRRQPTANPQQLEGSLHELLHQSCQAIRRSYQPDRRIPGIISLQASVVGFNPATPAQLLLFAPPRAVDDRFQESLGHLITKYGGGIFYQPLPVETTHPLPERRYQLQEISPASQPEVKV